MAESAYSEGARKTISRHVRKHRKEGMPQKQAVAAAMSEARRKGKKAPARKGANKKASKGRKSTKRSQAAKKAARTRKARGKGASKKTR